MRLIYISVSQIFEKFVIKFVDDFIKAIDILYNVYNCLLNFEFNYLNISLIGFISFFGFYRIESFIITTATMFKAEVIRNVLDNKSVVYIIGSKRKKKRKKRLVNLFVIIVVIGLNDIYFIKFFVFLFYFCSLICCYNVFLYCYNICFLYNCIFCPNGI